MGRAGIGVAGVQSLGRLADRWRSDAITWTSSRARARLAAARRPLGGLGQRQEVGRLLVIGGECDGAREQVDCCIPILRLKGIDAGPIEFDSPCRNIGLIEQCQCLFQFSAHLLGALEAMLGLLGQRLEQQLFHGWMDVRIDCMGRRRRFVHMLCQ